MEKLIGYKNEKLKYYIHLRINKAFGLGINFSYWGVILIIGCFYFGIINKTWEDE